MQKILTITFGRVVLTLCLTLLLLATDLHENTARAADDSGSDPATDTSAAVASIEALHANLLAVMQNADELGFDGRYQKLLPVIESKFDFPIISQVILGRHWDDLNADQQQQFIELFTELTVATYASRFKAYAGEKFTYLQTEPLNKQRLLVQTQLLADGETIRLDYLMHERNGHWYIISVVAQGVNDLSLKRAEYTALIEDQGFAALLDELRSKLEKLRPNTA